MGNTISAKLGTTGLTVYAQMYRDDWQVYNASGPAFETENPADWSGYALAAVDSAGTGLYKLAVPAIPYGSYSAFWYTQADGAPSQANDVLVAKQEFGWTGIALIEESGDTLVLTNLTTEIADIQEQTDQIQFDGSGFVKAVAEIDDPNIALIKAQTDKLQFDSSLNVKATVTNLPASGFTILYRMDASTTALVVDRGDPVTLEVARGIEFPLQFLITDATGASKDLTGYKAIFMVKRDINDPDDTDYLLVHKDTGTLGGLSIPSPLAGIIDCTIAASETAESLPYIRFPVGQTQTYSLKLFDASGIPHAGPWGDWKVVPFGVATTVAPV